MSSSTAIKLATKQQHVASLRLSRVRAAAGRQRVHSIRAEKKDDAFVRVPVDYTPEFKGSGRLTSVYDTKFYKKNLTPEQRAEQQAAYEALREKRAQMVEQYTNKVGRYTGDEDGAVTKTGSFNVFTGVGALLFFSPIFMILLAYFTYGTLWG